MTYHIATLTYFPFELVVVLFSKWLPVLSFFLVALHCIALNHQCPCNCGLMLALYAFYLNASCGVFLTFINLHRCISSRYSRCATRGTKGQSWSRARRWCTGGLIQKMEVPTWVMLGPEMLSSWSNWRPGPRSEGSKALFLLTLT